MKSFLNQNIDMKTMGMDEEMRDRGMFYLERMFETIEKSILRGRYRVCKQRGHHEWYDYRNREICDSCWRDSSTINEEPTPRDIKMGLMRAREIFRVGLKPLTL